MKNSGKEPTPGASSIEEALQATAENIEEMASLANRQLEEQLRQGRTTTRDLQDRFQQSTADFTRQAEYFVEEKPWRAVGIAAAIGFLAGMFLNRR